MPEPNKILGLDGKLYQELQTNSEEINNQIESSKNIPETGMIMDGTNNTLKDAVTGKVDNSEMLEKLIAYQNKKPSIREHEKIGRNDLCPCGSGKKYKNCCLNTGKYEKYIKMK